MPWRSPLWGPLRLGEQKGGTVYRLFVAVDLPETVRQLTAELRGGIPGARWVPAEQLHLTLRFIGDADETRFQAIRERLGRITAKQFPMALQGTGCFPSPKRPRILWVGVEAGEPLTHLQRQVEEALVALGITPEDRPFSPHITLARLKEPRTSEVIAFNATHGTLHSAPWTVDAFYLYSSTLTSQGASHRREATYPLTV